MLNPRHYEQTDAAARLPVHPGGETVMSAETLIDIGGWVGAVALLSAYALVSNRRLAGDSVRFQALNLRQRAADAELRLPRCDALGRRQRRVDFHRRRRGAVRAARFASR